MNSKRIAYSLNGEGYGHYGRSIGIIKFLANYFPDFQIDVYCYYNTYSIISKDLHLLLRGLDFLSDVQFSTLISLAK